MEMTIQRKQQDKETTRIRNNKRNNNTKRYTHKPSLNPAPYPSKLWKILVQLIELYGEYQ